MRTQRSPANRTTGILLLAIIASISLTLSTRSALARTQTVPVAATHSTSGVLDPVAVARATPASRPRAFVPACPRTGIRVLPASAASYLKGRIFAEDTTSSSSDVLKAARFECMMESRRTAYPISSAFQNSAASVANRQRAP